jgi:hypothetical protein
MVQCLGPATRSRVNILIELLVRLVLPLLAGVWETPYSVPKAASSRICWVHAERCRPGRRQLSSFTSVSRTWAGRSCRRAGAVHHGQHGQHDASLI